MVEQENRMSGRARATVAFLTVTVILYLFNGLCAGLSRVCWPCYR